MTALANIVLGCVAWLAWQAASWILGLPSRSVWPRGTLRVAHGLCLLATIAIAFLAYVGCLALFRVRGAEELWALPRKLAGRLRR